MRMVLFVMLFPLTTTFGQSPDWVKRSDSIAYEVLKIRAQFNPEGAAATGLEGYDDEIIDLGPEIVTRRVQALRTLHDSLTQRQKAEQHPKVKQDIQIMLQAVANDIRGSELDQQHFINYIFAPQVVFGGLRALLNDQVNAQRRPAALERLKKYAGLVEGYVPISRQCIDRIQETLSNPNLQGPMKEELEQDLANFDAFVAEIPALFDQYGITGYQHAYSVLKTQFNEFKAFIQQTMPSRARENFRLPKPVYAFRLETAGVTIPPNDLISRAQLAYMEIVHEMNALTPLVAAKMGIAASDYRELIAELKKRQFCGDEILTHYQSRIKDVEKIIKDNDIVTLPRRPMKVRLASAAESAALPSPFLNPPRIVGNTGEMCEFILPLMVSTQPGQSDSSHRIDDFSFEAASWTLTAHEARPGHELQFSTILENGISLARAIFAFNWVNVEGWALYCEAVMKPYMPLEAQFISLQHRLMRASRAFLDPMLQQGEISPDDAKTFLIDNVGLSPAFAQQDVDRYTFRDPGQATSYFFGYSRLMQLRAETERRLCTRFKMRAYHDFLLAQGLLPPDLLRQAVMEQHIPKMLAVNTD